MSRKQKHTHTIPLLHENPKDPCQCHYDYYRSQVHIIITITIIITIIIINRQSFDDEMAEDVDPLLLLARMSSK